MIKVEISRIKLIYEENMNLSAHFVYNDPHPYYLEHLNSAYKHVLTFNHQIVSNNKVNCGKNYISYKNIITLPSINCCT